MEESPVMKAFREFASADPNNCDREWEACLALGRDKATASGSSPTNSTSPPHNRAPAAAVTAPSTTRSTAPLCARSGATSPIPSATSASAASTTALAEADSAPASTRVSRPATKDDLSPEARLIYDYIVGNSAAPPLTASPPVPSSAISNTTSSAAFLCTTTSTRISTVLPETAGLDVVPIRVDINMTELAATVPTTCSSKCPSKDAAASVSVIVSSTATNSSTTICGVIPELAAPAVSDKALDMDVTGDTTLAATVCLPGGPDQITAGNLPISSRAPKDVLELFMLSRSTCSTNCSGHNFELPSRLLPETCKEFNVIPTPTAFVPWPPPSWTRTRPLLICGHILCQHAQQNRGKEFLVKDSKGKWNASWIELSEDRHLFERMKVVKLKPPWPPSLGVCTNLPMGNLSNLFGSISVNDNSSPCASWCLDDVLWKLPKCWPDLPCAQPCWPDPPWPPPPLNRNTTCRILNLHGTLDNMQLSGDCQVLETWELRLGAVLIVVILVPRVQKAQLKPTVFTWLYLLCSDIQFLSSSILDFLLARRPTYTLWTQGCLHNLHYSPGSNIFAIPDWELLILSLKTWMLVNCDFASVNFQWSITVQQSPSSNGFLAILNGEAEVQQHCSCMSVLTDTVRKGWIHCQFLRGNAHCSELQSELGFQATRNILFFCCVVVQWKNHWKNSLVSLFRFQYRSTRRESLYSCENFQWTIAWVLSYHFPLSTLQTRPHGAILLVQLNYAAIYQDILVQLNYQPYSSNCSQWEIAWLLVWSSGVGPNSVCGLIVTVTFWLLFKPGVLPPLRYKDLSFWRYPSVDDIMPNSGCIIQCGFEHLQWKIAWSLNWECLEIAHSTSKELLLLHMGISAGTKTLQLPWDPGDRFSSVWHEGYPKGEDGTCFIPSIDTSHVPWDPGGLEQHRLGDKPKFKKGGLSATFLSTPELGNGPAPLGLGLQEDTKDNHYIYLREGHGQGGLEPDGNGGFGRGLE